MSKKGLLLLQIICVVSLNSCLLSRTFILDRSPPDIVWETDFRTGLVVETGTPKAISVIHGPQITIREFLTRDIVYNEELDWHTNTSIELMPGKYILDFHVDYWGFEIWKYKGFFMVDDEAPTHMTMKLPRLVSSQPKVVFR